MQHDLHILLIQYPPSAKDKPGFCPKSAARMEMLAGGIMSSASEKTKE